MIRKELFKCIEQELKFARDKHPEWPSDPIHQVAIMMEEAGEVLRAVNSYHHEQESYEEVTKELIQTAAMCIRIMEGY